jgi:K+-sensing histidine kinase KdpD
MNGVSVQMKPAKDLPLVQGDRVQLLQVMVNLIINAIEAGRHVSNVPILLQKSKIERCRKSRESGFLDTSTAAIPRSADAKVRGHFCAKQLGPSHRLIRNASGLASNWRAS